METNHPPAPHCTGRVSPRRLLTACAIAIGWGATLAGMLQVQNLPNTAFGEHSVCGPWGCGAPLPVLLACHGFWLVLIAPAAYLVATRLQPFMVSRLGYAVTIAALLGLVALGVWEGVTWLGPASEWQRAYIVQGYLFAIVTLVDVPLVELLFAGLGLVIAGRARSLNDRAIPIEPTPADAA